MAQRIYNVLFLCTGNSARSILAEAILNQKSGGLFRAYSAGSHPKGEVHPFALELLKRNGFAIANLRSKSWDEFASTEVPKLDFVLTVCDNAAGEMCPIWPGRPVTAHWGIEDPAAVEGTEEEKRKAFFDAFIRLNERISQFVNLPVAKLDRHALQTRLREIAQFYAEADRR